MGASFHGLPARAIENGQIRLELLEGAGPRIVRLMRPGGPNLFAELPEKHWEVPGGRFYIRGGHRLWHAPEQFPRTYQPDNEGVTIAATAEGLALHGPVEPATGLAKTITVALAAGRAAATITHKLRNEGIWPVELAPWAISQMRLGGTAIVPLGRPAGGLGGPLPDRQIISWPYTKLTDPRITIADDYVFVEGRAAMPPAKVGSFVSRGWCAYWIDDTIFLKRFAARPGLTHPDLGCNVEVYFDQEHLELETLAPLGVLAPGETATHVEEWELLEAPAGPPTPEAVAALAAELGLG